MQDGNIFSYLFDVKFLWPTNMGSLQKSQVEAGLKFQNRREEKSYERRMLSKRKVIRIERESKNMKIDTC